MIRLLICALVVCVLASCAPCMAQTWDDVSGMYLDGDGNPFEGAGSDGFVYSGGSLYSGFWSDGLLYDLGSPFSGENSGVFYSSGALLNGSNESGLYCENGVVLTGLSGVNGYLYRDGALANEWGHLIEGAVREYYSAGVITHIDWGNGKLMYVVGSDPVPFNGTLDGVTYSNGVAVTEPASTAETTVNIVGNIAVGFFLAAAAWWSMFAITVSMRAFRLPADVE
jgi:hypothetical protein